MGEGEDTIIDLVETIENDGNLSEVSNLLNIEEDVLEKLVGRVYLMDGIY